MIGAHYDSVAAGRGAFDNASGVALMMELADALRDEKTPYTLVFVAFGAEEVGLRGSTHYVAEMSDQARADTILMINFDSVATGDRLYCYSSEEAAWPQLALRSMARGLGISILTSPGLNKDHPYGTTGDWSDHVAFRKAGIPYLYFEATNWLLGDKDGYLNTVKDREVWHSKKDTLSYIEQRYPGRMEQQLDQEFTALTAFLTEYEIPASESGEAAGPPRSRPAATDAASPAAQSASPRPTHARLRSSARSSMSSASRQTPSSTRSYLLSTPTGRNPRSWYTWMARAFSAAGSTVRRWCPRTSTSQVMSVRMASGPTPRPWAAVPTKMSTAAEK